MFVTATKLLVLHTWLIGGRYPLCPLVCCLREEDTRLRVRHFDIHGLEAYMQAFQSLPHGACLLLRAGVAVCGEEGQARVCERSCWQGHLVGFHCFVR